MLERQAERGRRSGAFEDSALCVASVGGDMVPPGGNRERDTRCSTKCMVSPVVGSPALSSGPPSFGWEREVSG